MSDREGALKEPISFQWTCFPSPVHIPLHYYQGPDWMVTNVSEGWDSLPWSSCPGSCSSPGGWPSSVSAAARARVWSGTPGRTRSRSCWSGARSPRVLRRRGSPGTARTCGTCMQKWHEKLCKNSKHSSFSGDAHQLSQLMWYLSVWLRKNCYM